MAPPLLRILEREATVFRRLWRGSFVSSVIGPFLFLAAMGFGLGGLVEPGGDALDGLDYLTFIAPGLLVASTAATAAGESLWGVMGGTKWLRTYHAIVTSPIAATDLVGGLLAWVCVRVALSASVFLVVAALLGAVPSWTAPLAVPAAALNAVAFAAPLAAWSSTRETDVSFAVVMRLVVMPLFLFSGVFFPVGQLPGWVQPLVVASPLYHGVELCRAATTGTVDAVAVVVHVLVLGGFTAAGYLAGRRTFVARLAA